MTNLQLFDLDRAVTAPQRQELAAAVHLALYVVLAGASRDRHGNAQVQMSVASVQINICSQVRGHTHREAAIARAQIPVVRHSGTMQRGCLDTAIAGLDIEHVKPSADLHSAVAGLGAQFALEGRNLDSSVTGVKRNVAFAAVQLDGAIAGVRMQASFDLADRQVPVSALQIHVSGDAGQIDVAVPGLDIQIS